MHTILVNKGGRGARSDFIRGSYDNIRDSYYYLMRVHLLVIWLISAYHQTGFSISFLYRPTRYKYIIAVVMNLRI